MLLIFMDNVFTKEIVERTRLYFLNCHNTSLSYEQAELYLRSLASLYLTFSGVGVVEMATPAPHPKEGAGDSNRHPHLGLASAFPDLISPHNCKTK